MKIRHMAAATAGLIVTLFVLFPSAAQAWSPFPDSTQQQLDDAVAQWTCSIANSCDDGIRLQWLSPRRLIDRITADSIKRVWVILDSDEDSVLNGADNCPDIPNLDQANLNNDGQGDACDDDIDGDGIANDADTCRLVANTDQADLDADGEGDACSDDDDGDGIADDADNCGAVANTDQADEDGDGTGDACDDTPSGDASGAGDGSSPEDGAASGGNNTPSGFGLMADEGGCSMIPATGSPWGFLIIAGGVLLLAFRRKRG